MFKLTIETCDLRFKNRAIVDTMFLDAPPVIHVVNKVTQFSAAAFLCNSMTAGIWKTITFLWIQT